MASGYFQNPGSGIGGVSRNLSRVGSMSRAGIGDDSEARVVAKPGEA